MRIQLKCDKRATLSLKSQTFMSKDNHIKITKVQQLDESDSVQEIKMLDDGKNVEKSDNKEKSKDELSPPSYLEVQGVIKSFKRLYPSRNFQSIISYLYTKIKQSSEDNVFIRLKDIFVSQGPQLPQLFISNHEYQLCERKKEVWTKEMVYCLARIYAQNPSELSKIEEKLKLNFNCSSELLIPRNIKYQLQQIFKRSLEKIRNQQELPQCIAEGFKFRRLQRINQQNEKLIFSAHEAQSVRVKLCEFYCLDIFDMTILISTILSVNEYVNWMNNLVLRKNLKLTQANNSINREQYEFAGKRRKVLRLKQQKKPRKPPSYL